MAARGLEEERMNKEVPRQVEQVPQDVQRVQGAQGDHVPPQGDHVPNVEGANLSMVPRVNVVERNMTSRLRYFVRMNSPIFLGCKVAEDPQEFLVGVYKVLSSMGVTSREKAKLDSYRLRDLFQIWYTQWKDNRPEDSGPIEKKGKQVAPSVPKDDAPTKRCFYALRYRGEKPDDGDDDGAPTKGSLRKDPNFVSRLPKTAKPRWQSMPNGSIDTPFVGSRGLGLIQKEGGTNYKSQSKTTDQQDGPLVKGQSVGHVPSVKLCHAQLHY
ncbi:hypothetical protein EJD97_024135 [Solanum chilense]|uniref:Uncharacterized protein n=1 Tax=Solanum chilense TaxID=4083 RepID=A0A6N2C9W3_SOLCI|nr:hypothetical protein EJD97_024135 [Solanum chilense]